MNSQLICITSQCTFLKSMKYTEMLEKQFKNHSFLMLELSRWSSVDFLTIKFWKRRFRTNNEPIYTHAGARRGLWWLKLSWQIFKKKNFLIFFFLKFLWFLLTHYKPSETHACPCVPIDGFGISPGPPFSDFVDLKVPAICCR